MPATPLEPGDPPRLGRYELSGRLGEGGQGVVYLGHAPDGTDVAVKVLRTSADPKILDRLARELEAIHQVQPFVTARVIEAGADGSRRYVVTEFIDGPSLQERVTTGGPLRDGELHRLAVGTATALTAIHGAGVIHRDFKPANVLLGPDGPRVVDFGIARLVDTGTITSHLIGTPSYLAPEQLRGEPATPAIDVFAWAVTIAFAATGRPPFGHDTVPAVMNRIMHAEPDLSGVPAALRGVLGSCLAKDPGRRPTARDLLVRLVDPSAAPVTVSDGAPTVPGQGRRSRRGRPFLAACAVIAVLLVLALGGWVLLRDDGRARAGGGRTSPSTATPGTPDGKGAVTVPASFAGTWTGNVRQSASILAGAKTTAVRITLTAGRSGGSSRYLDWRCDDTLQLVGVNDRVLTFQETAGGTLGCLGGVVTLTKDGDDLKYHGGTGPLGEVTDGTLRRSG
jgi:predicted Ser/Thr protein kinase